MGGCGLNRCIFPTPLLVAHQFPHTFFTILTLTINSFTPEGLSDSTWAWASVHYTSSRGRGDGLSRKPLDAPQHPNPEGSRTGRFLTRRVPDTNVQLKLHVG